MRTIERSSAFKKDYKLVKATPRHRKDIDEVLETALKLLMQDLELPERFSDHPLSGNRKG
jgi:mRNA interferase YafQ